MDRVFKENMQGDMGIPAQPSVGKAEVANETLFNFDISSNIPKILLPMDTEDSPWGGM